eukprot:6022134-Lingulodinium_polyedra.AAC.1
MPSPLNVRHFVAASMWLLFVALIRRRKTFDGIHPAFRRQWPLDSRCISSFVQTFKAFAPGAAGR